MAVSREQLVQTVSRSPEAVLAQDKAGWLAVFSAGGVVEDPVGTAPNRRGEGVRGGDDALGRFWDTFIAGSEVRFEILEELVAGDEVVRDVVIHTTISTGLSIDVPAHLLYRVVDEDGAPRLARLRAVWDLRQRTANALASGLLGLWTLCVVSVRMFGKQGVSGVMGYTRGLLVGIFGRGRQAVAALVEAVRGGEGGALEALFAPGGTVEFPVGEKRSPREWLASLGAGTALSVSQVTPAGWITSFRFSIAGGARDGAGGVAFLEFDPPTKRIVSARFFVRGGR